MFHPDNRGNATIALKKIITPKNCCVVYMSRIKINLSIFSFFICTYRHASFPL